jgi:hypothetical protein
MNRDSRNVIGGNTIRVQRKGFQAICRDHGAGCSVTTSCFVDADHAGCQLTRGSHSGVLIFVNRTNHHMVF